MEKLFDCCKLEEGLIQIQDKAGHCATLVIGQNKALLFDAMMGIGDLKSFVKTFTDLPLIVVNSHGHLDHIGGNCQFEKVYIHPAERELLAVIGAKLPAYQKGLHTELDNCQKSLEAVHVLEDILPGEVLELGGLHAEVLGLPGHTAGSIGLLLKEKKILTVANSVKFFPDKRGLIGRDCYGFLWNQFCHIAVNRKCADLDASVLTQSDGFTTEEGWDVTGREWYGCVEAKMTVLTEPQL